VARVLRRMRVLRILRVSLAGGCRFHEREQKAICAWTRRSTSSPFCAVGGARCLLRGARETGTLFTSIPQAMWWGIVTLTTTGYGDMYPTTLAGRIFAACTMITGLALFGLLMNVVGDALHVSLFGVRQAAAQVAAGVGGVGPAAPGGVLTCGCGQVLNASWKACPMCQTPVRAALMADRQRAAAEPAAGSGS
jgi:hypothetical protein